MNAVNLEEEKIQHQIKIELTKQILEKSSNIF